MLTVKYLPSTDLRNRKHISFNAIRTKHKPSLDPVAMSPTKLHSVTPEWNYKKQTRQGSVSLSYFLKGKKEN